MGLNKDSKVAIACRGGPENGPFSAQVMRTLREGFEINGYDDVIKAIYAVSGSSPTALLGCIGEEEKLCNIWFNLTPEEIVGDMEDFKSASRLYHKFDKWKTMLPTIGDWKNVKKILSLIGKLKEGYAISNVVLYNLLREHSEREMDRIFGPEAALMKIGAVDFLTGQHIIFSNRIPEQKDQVLKGVIGSMCLVPWFPSPTIDEPRKLRLIPKTHADFDALLLVDGGYRAGVLLEEAIRESIGFDFIFVVDINGLQVKDFNPSEPYNIGARIQRVLYIRSTAHDQLTLSVQDRIDEEIALRDELKELKTYLASLNPTQAGVHQSVERINELVSRMDNGRLRLHDKHAPQRYIVSNPQSSIPFDFTKFKQWEVAHLMRAGHQAALRVLRELGLSTAGMPLIRP